MSHDEDMVADFADDIDTLLVFVSAPQIEREREAETLCIRQAGLFSAVLTAFLAVSIALLQPDNSQLSVQLLSLIALQNGAPSSMQAFLNATAESLPATTTFQAPTSVVAINALWFTSLVLGLATALLGILAKKWCREYLRWHSVIASARENVLVRQLRFDAWERWRVPSCIAFIPAFLEIALVLFLVGLIIFVPTFANRSLTIVLSVVIASALLSAVALTLLPVFFRLCPFQTPTGWAFVRLAGFLRRKFWQLAVMASGVLDWIFDIVGRDYQPAWSLTLWLIARKRLPDIEKLQNWRTYSMYLAMDEDLCQIAVSGIKLASAQFRLDSARASIDVIQSRVLASALWWVRHGSNDERVVDAIRECVPTVHRARSDPWEVVWNMPYFLSSVYLMCKANVHATCDLLREFVRESEGSFWLRSDHSRTLKQRNGLFLNIADWAGLQREHLAACDAWERDPASLEVCHAVLCSDVLLLVDEWLARPLGVDGRKELNAMLALLLCLLRIVPSGETAYAVRAAGLTIANSWAVTMEEFYRRLAPHKEAYVCGLMPMCVELCRLVGPVCFGRAGEGTVVGEPRRCFNHRCH